MLLEPFYKNYDLENTDIMVLISLTKPFSIQDIRVILYALAEHVGSRRSLSSMISGEP
jgi:hypothetical protein